jgi:hypothetical protein
LFWLAETNQHEGSLVLIGLILVFDALGWAGAFGIDSAWFGFGGGGFLFIYIA